MVVGSWLHRGCESDVLALLKALDSVSNEPAANHALAALLVLPTPRLECFQLDVLVSASLEIERVPSCCVVVAFVRSLRRASVVVYVV